jgi:squalene-hopene/tetraprenyl-beta-curcumene cyclase
MALLAADRPDYELLIRKARAFLIGLQQDFGERGKTDKVFDGGIGYGSHYDHSDMGNTLQALEAIYVSRVLAPGKELAEMRDLNWAAAIQFLQNCQNLPGSNSQPWVSRDPKDIGGFVYYPGHSMAGGTTNAEGRVALRSYGSISYAGLLSYIYADLKRDDPRVRAVFEWLRKNYTLQENPAMGAQGLFYYYHTMAKALHAYGVRDFEVENGDKVKWRRDLAMRLINLQQRDGSWINQEHGRWWEKDPVLVTSYAVLTLEIIHRGL